jgi:hypothetical protein
MAQSVGSQDVAAGGSGAASGAATGAQVAGPWGAVVGGVLGFGAGMAGSYMGRGKSKKAQRDAARREAEQRAKLERMYREAEGKVDTEIAGNESALAGRDAQILAQQGDPSFLNQRQSEYTTDLEGQAAAINADLGQRQTQSRLSLLRKGKLGSSSEAEQGALLDADAQQQILGAEDQLGQGFEGAEQGRAAQFRALRLRNAGGDPYANDAIDVNSDLYDAQAGGTGLGRRRARMNQQFSRDQDALWSQTLGKSLSTAGNQWSSQMGGMSAGGG